MGCECPRCQKDDMVVKVSSIFSSGFSMTSQSGPAAGIGLYGGKIGIGVGGSSSSGINVSQLSLRLKPPSKPKINGCLMTIIVLSLVLFLVFFFMTLPYLKDPTVTHSTFLWLAASVGLIVLLFFIQKSHSRKMKIYNELQQNWAEYYYCSRDDVVFMCNDDEFMSPEIMQSYFESANR